MDTIVETMQYRGKYAKPQGWTEQEAETIFSENGWQGSQETLMSLLHRLGTFKKWHHAPGSLVAHMHVSNFVIEFQTDRLAGNGLCVKMLPGIDELLFFSFQHSSDNVLCSFRDDEWYLIDGKPVLRCTITQAGHDFLEQEDEAQIVSLRHFRQDVAPQLHQKTTCFQLLLEKWNKIGGQVDYGST